MPQTIPSQEFIVTWKEELRRAERFKEATQKRTRKMQLQRTNQNENLERVKAKTATAGDA